MMSDDEQAIASTYTCVTSQGDTWKCILRPVTIFQVLRAETSPIFNDKSLVIEGRGFGAVTLVAHVVNVEVMAAKIVYTLEDGTGRIKAEKDFSNLSFHQGSSAMVEKEEITQSKAYEHTYVEITGSPYKGSSFWTPKITIQSICPIHDYNHVMYHILNVINSNKLTQQCIQPYNPDGDTISYEPTILSVHQIPSHTFLPQRRQPYTTLEPLERAIMAYMYHKNQHILISELAQKIQTSYACTESQFYLAIQTLLLEAYITSPLDDGYVVLTPRQ